MVQCHIFVVVYMTMFVCVNCSRDKGRDWKLHSGINVDDVRIVELVNVHV